MSQLEFAVGDEVCACDCKHHVVVSIDEQLDVVEMIDGFKCSVRRCGVELVRADGECHLPYLRGDD